MKKTIYLFLVVFIFGFGTISCSSDDNQPTIVGAWEFSKLGAIITGQEILIDWEFPYPECTKDFLEFTTEGKVLFHEFDSYDDLVCEEDVEVGFYSISGNNLMVVNEDEEQFDLTIETLTKTILKLKGTGLNDFGEEATGIVILTKK